MKDQKAFILKKFVYELIGESEDDLMERLASFLTEKDMQNFGNVLNKAYEKGFNKAVNDYKQELGKLGIKLLINVKKNKDGSP